MRVRRARGGFELTDLLDLVVGVGVGVGEGGGECDGGGGEEEGEEAGVGELHRCVVTGRGISTKGGGGVVFRGEEIVF